MIPQTAHLFPITFSELRTIIRSLRLMGMQLDPEDSKELALLAFNLEKELNLALEKEKQAKIHQEDVIRKLRNSITN